MTEIDRIDRVLLRLLQEDARLTAQDLAQRANLSASQCARRRQRLEAEGLINGYRAMVDPARVGANIQAFVQVAMAAHSRENAEDFERAMHRQAEVVGMWTLTGESDYLLQVYTSDLSALNRLVQEGLLPHPAVARVQSQIVMAHLKCDAPVPVTG